MINTKLFDLAKEVAQQAYAPYSHFRVGATLITDTGNIYQGSICAERNAIFNMVSNGDRIITEIAIYVDSDKIFPPCGACRQVLAEFGEDIIIYYGNDHQITETTLKEILPHTFRLK